MSGRVVILVAQDLANIIRRSTLTEHALCRGSPADKILFPSRPVSAIPGHYTQHTRSRGSSIQNSPRRLPRLIRRRRQPTSRRRDRDRSRLYAPHPDKSVRSHGDGMVCVDLSGDRRLDPKTSGQVITKAQAFLATTANSAPPGSYGEPATSA